MQEESSAHRRLAENEVASRQRNREVEEGFDSIRALEHEEGHATFINRNDEPLHFHCECSADECNERIVIPPSEYNALHKVNNQFIVAPGHERADIERVIEKRSQYYIIEKYHEPPKTAKPNASA
jgi:hypothetical protein